MLADSIPKTVKLLRRGPLLPQQDGELLHYAKNEVEKILPHRAPFLLVDTIEAYDQDKQSVRGCRYIDLHDPVFVGHFPDMPIYPGVLVVEAIGQMALTMIYLNAHKGLRPTAPFPMQARATRIHHAAFYAPFAPGDTMTLHAQQIESDLTMIAIGQAWRGEVLAACAILEVLIDEVPIHD